MKLTTKSDQEILAIATPIMDNLMKGSTKIDHARHTRDFSERLKGIVTKEHLKQICRRYQAEWGYFSRREFVAEMVLLEEGSGYLVDHVMVF